MRSNAASAAPFARSKRDFNTGMTARAYHAAMAADDRTMFEIYRETDYNRSFHYIFYSDLDEHEREREIAKAANGQTVFTGYIDDTRKEAARALIEAIVDELNESDDDTPALSNDAIRGRLGDHLAPPP
jgi:hypothetical protein